MPHSPRPVVLVVYPEVQTLDVVGPAEVFAVASRLTGAGTGYQVLLASVDGATVRTDSGLRLAVDTTLADLHGPVDTLVVAGGLGYDTAAGSTELTEGIARLARQARRVCSVCSGAVVLASAGLLDNRRATTHWAVCDLLARRHPEVRVEPDRIFVRDGNVFTSAGATAGMDLALALVEADHGSEIARQVARWLVLFLQRPGGQSQFSQRLALPVSAGSPLRSLLDAIAADPAGDHRVPTLARRAGLSDRHLTRLFLEQTGTTPARLVERMRVEAARELLEGSATPADTIAQRVGFGSYETMRRAFLRTLGVGPGDYRDRFRSTPLHPWAEPHSAEPHSA